MAHVRNAAQDVGAAAQDAGAAKGADATEAYALVVNTCAASRLRVAARLEFLARFPYANDTRLARKLSKASRASDVEKNKWPGAKPGHRIRS
jgi:hypothetical protein